MFCRKCLVNIHKSDEQCSNCGTDRSLFRKGIILASALFLLVILSGAYLYQSIPGNTATTDQQTASFLAERSEGKKEIGSFEVPVFIEVREVMREEEIAARTEEAIEEAQETVYTIATPNEQGSGFLYSEDGIVLTSAHVVRGHDLITVVDQSGDIYEGRLLGSSDYMDIAVLEVEEFKGTEPFELDTSQEFDSGEEVAALGSPKGVQNTVTEGNITNTRLNLTIDEYEYEDLYEISAGIVEGNSGGPLFSIEHHCFIAINAAKSLDDPTIGYSVPLYKIEDLIDELKTEG
ncbi:S1C family serine protease [Salipaludibacillus keqinensis]|nr:S1C family serine protease [Salipaludibacillus keqinensis]